MAWQGFVLVLVGAFLIALFQTNNRKFLANKEAPADCMSTVNFLGSGFILLAVAYVFAPPDIKSWWPEDWLTWPLQGLFLPLMATSILNLVIMFGMYGRALDHGNPSLVSPIQGVQTLLVIVPTWYLLGEHPPVQGIIALVLLGAGVYAHGLAGDDFKVDPITKKKIPWVPPSSLLWLGAYARYVAPLWMLFSNKGVRITFYAAVCGALAISFDKLSALRSSYMFAPAFILIFCGIVGLVKTISMGEWKKMKHMPLTNLLLQPLILSLVLICYWSALHFSFAAYVSSLKNINFLFMLPLGVWILGETNTKRRLPGIALIVAGAVLLILYR